MTAREMELIWTGCYGESPDTKLPGNAAVMLMSGPFQRHRSEPRLTKSEGPNDSNRFGSLRESFLLESFHVVEGCSNSLAGEGGGVATGEVSEGAL